MKQEMYKPKNTFKSSTVFNFDFFFSFCTPRETMNIFSHGLQNTSNTLLVIVQTICTSTASKPSEESSSRDEIMIVVAQLTLKDYLFCATRYLNDIVILHRNEHM